MRVGDVDVHVLPGGLVLVVGGRALIIDAPADPTAAAHAARAAAVVFTRGSDEALAGWWTLLGALEARALPEPLVVWSAMDEPRPLLVAEAWTRGNGEPCPLVVDSDVPGANLDLPPFTVTTAALAGVERRRGQPVRAPIVGLRIAHGSSTIAYVPCPSPTAAARRLCQGADVAIVHEGPGMDPIAAGAGRVVWISAGDDA